MPKILCTNVSVGLEKIEHTRPKTVNISVEVEFVFSGEPTKYSKEDASKKIMERLKEIEIN